ncbi:MAG TPA: hypothetical protein DEA22_14955 [Blastocatellia bacterium]|nr:hypothetical protein [Blastocatellia bacterium]
MSIVTGLCDFYHKVWRSIHFSGHLLKCAADERSAERFGEPQTDLRFRFEEMNDIYTIEEITLTIGNGV